MQTIVFNGLIPKQGPVELDRGFGVEAENMYISTDKFLQPLRDVKEITDTIFDVYGNIFKSNIVTLIKRGDVWIAWDHFVHVIDDIRRWGSLYSFLFLEDGKIYRSSDKWVLQKIPPKQIGIQPPRKALSLQKDTQSIVPMENCPPFCEGGAYQGDARSYTFTYVNDMEEESQAVAFTDPQVIYPNEEGKFKLVDENVPPSNAVKRYIYRSLNTNTQEEDGAEEANLFLFVGSVGINDNSFVDTTDPRDFGHELSTILQHPLPENILGMAYVGDNRNVYWNNDNNLFVTFPRLPHTIEDRLIQVFPSPIVGAYSVVTTREGEHTYDLYVFTNDGPYYVSEITSPSNERIIRVSKVSISDIPVNPRAVCSVDGNLVYVSKRGMVSIDRGIPKDVLDPFFSKEEWRSLVNNVQLAYYENQLLMLTDVKNYVISLSFVYQDKIPSVTTTSLQFKHVFNIVNEGIVGTRNNRYYHWNDADNYLLAKWTSARFRAKELWRPNFIKVDAEAPLEYNRNINAVIKLFYNLLSSKEINNLKDFFGRYPQYLKYRKYLVYSLNPIKIRLFREGEIVFEAEYLKGDYLRVPRIRRGIYWQVSIETCYPVYRIMLEKSVTELANPQMKNEDI